MFTQTWGEVFTLSFQNLWTGFVSFVPSLILSIFVILVGSVLGSVISKWVSLFFHKTKIENLIASAGVHEWFKSGGVDLNVGKFFGELLRWFILIVFLMTSLEIAGLAQVNDFLRDVVLGYLPQVIIAALVLVIAAVVGSFLSKIITGSARVANIPSASFLGAVAKYSIWIFAIIIALSELGVAPQFMQILFAGMIASLAIAGGLAFGLGGKDFASRLLDKINNEIRNK